MNKVLVGYPHGGQVHPAFSMSVVNMATYEHRHPSLDYEFVGVGSAGSCYIPSNRNRLVRRLLAGDGTWMLQLDTDLEFRQDLLRVMMREAEAVGAKVLLGFYLNTKPATGDDDGLYTPIPMLHEWVSNGPGLFDGNFRHLVEVPPGRTFKVGGGGTGMVLVHRDVFEAIGRLHPRRHWTWFRFEEMPDGDEMGEDLAFCRYVVEAGFDVWATTHVIARHWKSLPVCIPEWWKGEPLPREEA